MIYLLAAASGIFNCIIYRICMVDIKKDNGKTPSVKAQAVYCLICMVAACLFTWLFSLYGYGPVKCVKYNVLLGGLAPIAYEDIKEKRIPNKWLVYLLVIRIAIFVLETVLYPSAFVENIKFTLSGGLICGGILFLAYIISHAAIGSGDVKLFAVIGMYLGLHVTYILIFVSLVLAAVYGIIRILLKKLNVKDELAFAPFIFVGAVIVLGLGF